MTGENAVDEEGIVRIRRILVALDASADSLAGLEAAARLAAELDADLQGLFVEDSQLLRAGRLGFSQEITLFSGEPRELEPAKLERDLRAQARQVEQALRRVAERLRVRWEFRSVRGRVTAELLAAAAEADLVAVGATGRSFAGAPGSTVRALLEEAGRPVLVLRQGARLGGPLVYALHDGTESGWEALRVAGQLGRREGARLYVLLAVDDRDEARRLGEEVRERLAEAGFPVRLRHLPDADVGSVCGALADTHGLLVAPGPEFRRERRALGRLLRSAGCPVVLVGTGEDR